MQEYRGKDKDFEVPSDEKIKFSKYTYKEGSTTQVLSDEDLALYYPKLKCF